jgi:Xaa-Pro aminopeptidase
MPRQQLAEFIRRMEPDSVAIIPAASEATRSNDTHYRYRQDSDFYYLTGFDEPESIAVVAPSRDAEKFTLFVRPRDAEQETWVGKRAGIEGAKERHGADAAFAVAEFRDKLAELLNGAKNVYYRLGVNRELDEVLIKQLGEMRLRSRQFTAPDSITDPSAILGEMRLVKSDAEIELMQRAADIAAEAHVEAMKAVRAGMMEYEIEALIEYHFRKSGAAAPAYGSIVGGGANATILHYVTNDAPLRDGDLLLIDAGAEYQGYASDITRTFPVNGRFSQAQREIYEAVLAAQVACIEMVKPGVTMDELNDHAIRILTERMVSLGLLEGQVDKLVEEKTYRRFFMHGIGHFLGLDVHDAGRYKLNGAARALAPGVVITVEPGIYIAGDAENVPDRFRGIGVRIEDDVLVTPEGHRMLTAKVPKGIEEIEKLMAR